MAKILNVHKLLINVDSIEVVNLLYSTTCTNRLTAIGDQLEGHSPSFPKGPSPALLVCYREANKAADTGKNQVVHNQNLLFIM